MQMFEVEDVPRLLLQLATEPPAQLQPVQHVAQHTVGTATTLLLAGGVRYFARGEQSEALAHVLALAQSLQRATPPAHQAAWPAKGMLDVVLAHCEASARALAAGQALAGGWPAGAAQDGNAADFRQMRVLPTGDDLLMAEQHFKYLSGDQGDGYLSWQVCPSGLSACKHECHALNALWPPACAAMSALTL